MNKQEYLQIVERMGFEIGDLVTLFRVPSLSECHIYGCGAAIRYVTDQYFGMKYSICDITARKNCQIRIGVHSYYVPQFCFEEFLPCELSHFSKSKFKEFDTKVLKSYG